MSQFQERNLMNRLVALRNLALIPPLLALCAVPAGAQAVPALQNIKSQVELYKAVATLDAALFDSYNHCDLKKFASLIADDVEFFHDKDGVTLGKANLVGTIKKNICGTDIRRVLVPGTLQVYPMEGYGALEIGVHRFLHPKTRGPTGEARFIQLWQYDDGAWKLTRVISYDHHALKK
jgi:Domain of unknown function (DUF4440)